MHEFKPQTAFFSLTRFELVHFFTFDGKRIEFTTGFRIDAEKWDAAKQRVKPKYTNKQKVTAAEINATLGNYELVIQDVFKYFEVQRAESWMKIQFIPFWNILQQMVKHTRQSFIIWMPFFPLDTVSIAKMPQYSVNGQTRC